MRQAGGTICFQERWWKSNEFLQELVRDTESRREGMLMHNKLWLVRSIEAVTHNQLSWIYIGSANLSESAWLAQGCVLIFNIFLFYCIFFSLSTISVTSLNITRFTTLSPFISESFLKFLVLCLFMFLLKLFTLNPDSAGWYPILLRERLKRLVCQSQGVAC